MKKVCVITGGSSGIGLAAAKQMDKENIVVLSGRSPQKLEDAVHALRTLDIDARVFQGDVSDRESVLRLAEYAQQQGTVNSVIHSAGISPQLGTPEKIFNINAMGTIYMNEELSKIMNTGGCIVDVASMSAYMLPFLLPDNMAAQENYELSLTEPEEFQKKMLDILSSVPGNLSDKVAYALSKDFVVWYAAQCACFYGKRGIRVLSVSPGTFDTPMGQLEGESAASYALKGALGRVGQPDEIGSLLKFCISDSASYLTGTDILCDGGTMAAMKRAMQKQR
ncbi:SDR family oxidoreductase [Lachnospiraceae bacterium 54-53]